MASEVPVPSNPAAPQGLPPVNPPSGRFILQLFLIPGLIVAVLVMVMFFGGMMLSSTSTPDAYLAKLDNPNPDIRWRAAHELAQVLKRPESLELASNPDFAMEIALRLRKAWKDLEKAEGDAGLELAVTTKQIRANTALKPEEKEQQADQAYIAAFRKLRPQRDLVLFLINSLGDFTVPVGVPVLCEIAVTGSGAEPKGLALRRRRAVWALGNLGENYKRRYQGIDPPEGVKALASFQKTAILQKLSKAAEGEDERAKMAQYTVDVLQGKRPHNVDHWLALAAQTDDVFLREMVAMALNFWDGPLVEPTLLQLSRDTGLGKRIVVTDDD